MGVDVPTCSHSGVMEELDVHGVSVLAMVQWLHEYNRARWMQGHGSNGSERLTKTEVNRCSRTGAFGEAVCRTQVEGLMATGGEVGCLLVVGSSGNDELQEAGLGASVLEARSRRRRR